MYTDRGCGVCLLWQCGTIQEQCRGTTLLWRRTSPYPLLVDMVGKLLRNNTKGRKSISPDTHEERRADCITYPDVFRVGGLVVRVIVSKTSDAKLKAVWLSFGIYVGCICGLQSFLVHDHVSRGTGSPSPHAGERNPDANSMSWGGSRVGGTFTTQYAGLLAENRNSAFFTSGRQLQPQSPRVLP